MVLDAERCLIAVENEFIYLSVGETIVLNLIIENKKYGISRRDIEKGIYPYYYHIIPLISKINRKIIKIWANI